MNSARNKSSSLYEQTNTDLRKKIIGNTMLQVEPEIERELPFKRLYLDPAKEKKLDETRPSTDRNMKFKLEQLDGKLQEFLNDLRGVRRQNRELLQFTALIKQNLIYEGLYGLKGQLDQQIVGFNNYIRSVKANNQARVNEIYGECSQLWKGTEQLRAGVFNLQMRVEKLQQKMGFKQMYRLSH